MGKVKIIFNENFYKKYPILWVFGYGYGYLYSISWVLGVEYELGIWVIWVFGYGYWLGRYTRTHTQNLAFFGYKALITG